MSPAAPDRPAVAAAPDPAERAANRAAALTALLAALREGAAWAGGMLRQLGEAAVPPGPEGGWAPVRIVVHLAAVDVEVWTPRLRQLAAHEHPVWAWTEPALGEGPGPSPVAAAEAFVAARATVLEIVAAMDDAALRCTGIHATFGELDVVGLLGEVLRHDAEHLASLAEAVAARSSVAAHLSVAPQRAGAVHG
jgi:hypothetical protein